MIDRLRVHARHIWLIARLALREAWRRRLLLIAILMGIAFLALYGFGLRAAYVDYLDQVGERVILLRSMIGTVMLTALYAVNFLIVATSVLTAVGAFSQEIANNTIYSIVAKPLHRWEIYIGRWLGHLLMIVAYTLFLVGSVFALTWLLTGYGPRAPIEGLALMVFEGMVILSVTLLGSTLLNTLANGVLVFMLYGLAFAGAWTEQIGAMVDSQTALDLGILSSLLLPTEALWRRASYVMQTALMRNIGVSPFGLASVPNRWFLVYSALYLIATVALAMRVFARRDL
jgi:Cu-processing system permease protein